MITQILARLKGRRGKYRRSFSILLESKDKGLYFNAKVHCTLTILDPRLKNSRSASDSLARTLLQETLSEVAHKFRLLDRDAAQDEINAVLCHGLQDADQRVYLKSRARLSVSDSEKRIAVKRAIEEQALWTAHARETIELRMLLDRLTDPILGPIWWISRHSDSQASADPHAVVNKAVTAVSELRNAIHKTELDQISDLKLLARRRLEDIFAALQDEQTLNFLLATMNSVFEKVKIGNGEGDSVINRRIE